MDKYEKLKKILELTSEGLTRQEFVNSFKKVFDQILKLESKLEEKIDLKTENEREKLSLLAGEFEQVLNKARQETDASLSGFRKRTIEAINNIFLKNDVNQKLREQLNIVSSKIKDIDNKLSEVKDGITPIKGIDYSDGENGKDADEEKIVKDVLEKIPDYKDEIKELKKEIEELKRLPARRGGGTSAMGVAQAFKWILKTESPVGLINGVNTEYTVKNTIFAVLAFSLNGEVIAQLPNYTISKNKIIFATALPAVYSGKDFEIKYI